MTLTGVPEWKQPVLPGMGRMKRVKLPKENPRAIEGPYQAGSWANVVHHHPDYEDHADAVRTLAFSTPDDPDYESYAHGDEHDLVYERRNVPLKAVRNNTTAPGRRQAGQGFDDRYTGLGDSRVRHAWQGFQESRGEMTRESQEHPVPPILLVKRGSGYEVADGHHRSEAAKIYGATHINAIVARSPYKDRVPERDY